MRSGHIVAVAAATVAIAGCCAACTSSSDAEPTGDTPVPSVVAPTHEPVPQSLPTPADDADPSTWTITAGGVGPVVIGNELDGLDAHMRAFTRDDSGCDVSPVATWTRDGAPSIRVLADAAGRIVGVAVLGDGGAPRALLRASPRTQTGEGVGSTIDELQASFPALVEFDGGVDRASARLDSWGVPVGDRWVTFGIDAAGARVQTVWVGMTPTPPQGVCG